MTDVAMLARSVAGQVKAYVAKATADLLARVAVLEARPPAPELADLAALLGPLINSEIAKAVALIPAPQPGKDFDPDLIERLVAEAVAKLPPAERGEPGEPGQPVDPALVKQLVADAVAALPPPADGKDADPALIARMVADAVAALPPAERGEPGAPGASVDMEQVRQLVDAAVAGLPKPLDGKDADPDATAALVAKCVEAAVAGLPAAKDGVGLAGAVIDRDGNLVVTMTDGTTKQLGPVVGRDVDMDAVAEMVRAIPRPKDGADGLGFDDLQFEHDGERGFTLRFVRGDQVREFPFSVPAVLDRGVYKAERAYEAGDAVSFGGALWIAQAPTSERPGEGATGWRLAVKSGRHGKSAYDLARGSGFAGSEREWLASLRGPPGAKGDPGKDLTQLGPDGRKW